MADHSETIATFCSIVGTTPHVAEHYLSGFEYDLNRAIEFFLEHPPDPSMEAEPGDPLDNPAPSAYDIPPEDPEDEALYRQFRAEEQQQRRQHPNTATATAPDRDPIDLSGDNDDELQRALAASLIEGGNQATATRASRPGRASAHVKFPDDDDDDAMQDDDLAFLAAQRAQAQAAARQAEADLEDAEPSPYTRSSRGRPRFADEGPSMFPPIGGIQGVGLRPGDPPSGFGPLAPRPLPHDADLDADLDLPEGVDRHELEEARMLEAALMGVPYEGHIPDFRNMPTQPAIPADLSVLEGRSLRWDQDQAYEESLAADRAKANALARAQREKEEAERAEHEAREADQLQKAEEERQLADSLSRKQRSLPEEPAAADPGSINIMVRMPDGSRLARRFRKADPLQTVFDFIDVQHQGATFKPGSYSLVNSYPRKVFVDGSRDSLDAAGITADTALFLEPGTAST